MKLVASLRLLPAPDQAVLLRETLERCNAACDWLAQAGADAKVTRQYDLHRIGYADMRSRFGLTAQAAVRCIAKVADAYKVGDKDEPRSFRRHAAQPYDARILRFLPGQDAVSIWTLAGRIIVPFACGARQRELLRGQKGECDLMLVRGKWLLATTCEVENVAPFAPADVRGHDMGVVNLLVDDRGATYTGEQVERVRRRHHSRRRALQKLGTRSAKRALRRASGKQARFQRHTSHCISKAVVASAERGRSAVALEDLEGIRDRVKVQRRQRARLHNWGFHELRTLIEYKALLRGVPVVLVDPRNTSRTCPACGCVDKRNRKTRDDFACIGCGFAGPADHVAAINIRSRGLVATGLVMTPEVATARAVSHEESRLL